MHAILRHGDLETNRPANIDKETRRHGDKEIVEFAGSKLALSPGLLVSLSSVPASPKRALPVK
jgi:hypothetical protein